jgi:hypothetical protein
MKTPDSAIKTSLRLPRSLHAEIEKAAAALGLSLNAEMILRLERNPHDDYAKAILDEIARRDLAVADGLRRQVTVLWTALDRANDALEKVAAAMSLVSESSDAAALKREVEFARELIGAVGAHR